MLKYYLVHCLPRYVVLCVLHLIRLASGFTPAYAKGTNRLFPTPRAAAAAAATSNPPSLPACLPAARHTMCWTLTFKPSDPTSIAMLVPASSPTYKAPSVISRPPKELRRAKTPYRLGEDDGPEGSRPIEETLGNCKGRCDAWTPPEGKKERRRRLKEEERRAREEKMRVKREGREGAVVVR